MKAMRKQTDRQTGKQAGIPLKRINKWTWTNFQVTRSGE